MELDEHFMAVAIDEAKKGMGRTSPNPCVGAVIVKDGVIISKGFHEKAGTPHAERNAIAAALGESLEGTTIYVTLEPCSHTGKTPPCCEALIEHKFSRVVIGMTDPNPLVDGKGIAWLKKAGIDVICGVLESECKALNRPFIKRIQTGRPWVIMKAGLSLDGRLNYQRGQSGWMTGAASLQRVHQLRNITDAILVGGETVRIDNPSLTTRLEEKNTRDPLRVILDSSLSLSLETSLLNSQSLAHTYIFCKEDVSKSKIDQFAENEGVTVIPVPSDSQRVSLESVLNILGEIGICSLLVEGGSRIHGSFLLAGLYDEAYLFYGPRFAGDSGVPLISGMNINNREVALSLSEIEIERLDEDFLVHGFFHTWV